jgi:hypothetical protein
MSVAAAAEILRREHAEHLARFQIPPEILEAAGVRSVTDSLAREILGLSGYRGADLGGILFPYLSPVTGMRTGGRIRLDHLLPNDGGKYISEPGCRHLFFAPCHKERLADTSITVVIVESEKAALALIALAQRARKKWLVIAVGGCWGWRRKIGRILGPDGDFHDEKGPSPDFDLLDYRGREVIICFDSNASTNPYVQRARSALTKELSTRGAHALVSEVPIGLGVNGPDDLIAVSGDPVMVGILDSARSFETVATSDVTKWPEPASLGDDLLPVPAFDLELLPSSLRPLVKDVSERMQTPLDYAAAAAIAALAGCVGRRASIRPKALDGSWAVTPNLWGAIIAPPGYMKSPVLRCITHPLTQIEELWRAKYQQDSEMYESEKDTRELRRQAWKEQYKAAYKKGGDARHDPEKKISPPVQKRLILSDSTFEKLHEILRDNPGGVFVLRDELTGWLAGLDRPGREQERAFYLEAWNGDSHFTVDRIGRGSVCVPAACVSLFGNIQPSRLRSYLSDAITGGPGDDGLFQRFQILVWPDTRPHWTLVDRAPNRAALDTAENVYVALSELSMEAPVQACFAPSAQELFFDWWADLEGKLRSRSGLHPAMVAHLSKYRSLMPSLALLFELANLAASGATIGTAVTVGLDHAKQATVFCEYLESHARRVYACIISAETRAARELADRIRARDLPAEFKTRDVYLKGWSTLDTPERARGALTILQDAGWVRRAEYSVSPAGGRPSEIWIVNPQVIRRA